MSEEVQHILKVILLMLECSTAFVGCIFLLKLKNSHWKWFSLYLIFICIQEIFWILVINDKTSLSIQEFRGGYYTFFGIPAQYIFFFWLYAYTSLHKKQLFYSFFAIYLCTFLITALYCDTQQEIRFFSIIIGTTLLAFLVVLEFIKQIKDENILNFKTNKMFYVNAGVLLFYIGTYPMTALSNGEFQESHKELFDAFVYYFFITNYLMYLLFAASFIWGKIQLK